MKAILFNDTSHYHSGCNAAMEYLHQEIKTHGLLLESVKSKEFPEYCDKKFKIADTIIINGEGTMHHDAPLAKWYLDLISKAYSFNKKIFLINTVWQEMTLTDMLKKILRESYVSVRDIRSQSELTRQNINAHFHLDLSYNNRPPDLYPGWGESSFNQETFQGKRKGLIIGTFSNPDDNRQKDIPSVNIFKESWNDIIQKLAQAEYFITGRHHEMYAACIARCPFYVFKGNSWKNEGLLRTASCHLVPDASMGMHTRRMPIINNLKENEKVSAFMKGQEGVGVFSKQITEIKKSIGGYQENKFQSYYPPFFDWMQQQTPFSFR